jgi:hypothetical protein
VHRLRQSIVAASETLEHIEARRGRRERDQARDLLGPKLSQVGSDHCLPFGRGTRPNLCPDGGGRDRRAVARHIAEIRGLLNQAIRRLERLEGELLAERHARVDDLALLVELVSSGWRGVDVRLERLEAASAEQPAPSDTVEELARHDELAHAAAA